MEQQVLLERTVRLLLELPLLGFRAEHLGQEEPLAVAELLMVVEVELVLHLQLEMPLDRMVQMVELVVPQVLLEEMHQPLQQQPLEQADLEAAEVAEAEH